jgi:uncharacterized membrane protein YphA (DoxX/SURF4 family)
MTEEPVFVRRLYLLSRLVVGGVFVYAGLDKIANPAAFAELIWNYMILPTELVNLAALVLPWVELTSGLLLIFGRLAFPSSLILTGLTLVFIAAIGYNLARGLNFQCGCFTTAADARDAGIETLIRDLALLAPAAVCLWRGWARLGG